MKVLGTSVPIFTSDFEAAIERFEALTGVAVSERFELTSARPSSSTRWPNSTRIYARRAQRRYSVQCGPRPAPSFFHQGQICLNTRRIIIQRKIYKCETAAGAERVLRA